MCSKPWEGMNVCYPTRVGHPGTVLEGRYFNNFCDDGQDMCSPWTPPASSFPAFAFVADPREDDEDSDSEDDDSSILDYVVAVTARRGCATAIQSEDQQDPGDFMNFIYSDAGGCAACDGIPFRGSTVYDLLCADGDGPRPQSDDYVSNSYLRLPSQEDVDEELCVCLWCPPEPPSGFDAGNYNYGNYDGFNDFFVDATDSNIDAFCGRL
jgi:hypothetical protein